jgi:hypothetical protein
MILEKDGRLLRGKEKEIRKKNRKDVKKRKKEKCRRVVF